MKRLVAVVAMLVLTLVPLAGCQPGNTQAESEFDDAIHGLEKQFTAIYSRGPSSSVDSIRQDAAKIDAEWSKVEASAKGVEGVDTKEASAAHEAFDVTVKGLADGTPDAVVTAAVMPKLEAFRSAVEKMHAAAGLHN